MERGGGGGDGEERGGGTGAMTGSSGWGGGAGGGGGCVELRAKIFGRCRRWVWGLEVGTGVQRQRRGWGGLRSEYVG